MSFFTKLKINVKVDICLTEVLLLNAVKRFFISSTLFLRARTSHFLYLINETKDPGTIPKKILINFTWAYYNYALWQAFALFTILFLC